MAASSGGVPGPHSLEGGSARPALLAGGLAVVLGLITWQLVEPDSARRASAPTHQARPPPAVARIDVGGTTVLKPIAAGGALWSIVEDEPGVRTLVRVDGRTLRPTRINLPVQAEAVAGGFGSIWVGGCTHSLLLGPCSQGVVLQLDALGKVLARVSVEGRPSAISTGESAVWAATWTGSDTWVYRVDPDSIQVAWRVSLNRLRPRFPCCVTDLAAGEGKVWVLFGILGPLVTLDPQTQAVSRRLPIDGFSLAVVEGSVWVMGRTRLVQGSQHSGSLSLIRVDPATAKVTATFPGQDLDGLAVGRGFVWWGHGSLGGGRSEIRLFRFDPAARRLRGPPVVVHPGPWRGLNLPLAGVPSVSVAVDPRALWVTTEARQVIRLEIARLNEIPPPPPPAVKVTRIPLNMRPATLSVAPFGVWTYESGGWAGEVVRIDTPTNRATRVRLDGVVMNLDAAEASAWVLMCPNPIGPTGMCPNAEVLQLHSGTGALRQRIRVGPLPEGAPMSVGGDSLWISRTHPIDKAAIIRVDPWKGRAVEAFPMACCIGEVIEGHGDLWFEAFERPFLRRIDMTTGRSRPVRQARPCRGPIFGAGSAWITTGCQGRGSPTILRIDPFTGEVVSRVDLPLGINELAVGEGSVWLIRADIHHSELHILRLDTASNQIEGLEIVVEPNPDPPTFGTDGLFYPVSAVAGEGALWVTNHVDGEVVRIEFDRQAN